MLVRNLSANSTPFAVYPEGRPPRSWQARFGAAVLALLAALVMAVVLIPAPGFAQEKSWDRDDPACVNPQPRSAQEAEQIGKKCNKTPEEKEKRRREA